MERLTGTLLWAGRRLFLVYKNDFGGCSITPRQKVLGECYCSILITMTWTVNEQSLVMIRFVSGHQGGRVSEPLFWPKNGKNLKISEQACLGGF